MGKNRTIKIIGGIIGVMVAHKILLKFTNKPESVNHLMSEVSNYRDNIQDWIREYNWNAENKKRIKDEAIKCLKEELKEPHFNDVIFPKEAITNFLDETMNEIGIERLHNLFKKPVLL